MTGLQKELSKHRVGHKAISNDAVSITGIANLLGIAYMSAKRKVKNNYFTTTESLIILNALFFEERLNMQFYEYLFTDINNK